MSLEHAWPSTGRTGGRSGPAPEKWPQTAGDSLWPALALSRFPVAFDLFVSGAAVLAVLPRTAFFALPPAAAIGLGAAAWALAYLAAWTARPILRRLDGRLDARLRVLLARALFAAATLALAFLPAGGAVAALLILVPARLAQGVALAGLSHGAAAPDRPAGLRASAIAGGLGLLAAGLVMGVLATALSPADFAAWGWRYPFVMALAVNLPALVADLQVAAARAPRRPSGRPQLRLVAGAL